MKIYRANYESRTFSFEAYGKTEKDARGALMTALVHHTHQYNLEADWYCNDDISVVEYQLNTPYRDRSILKGK